MIDKDFTFTGTLKSVSKEAMEELLKMSECDSYVIAIQVGDGYVNVATINRDKDCPKELFNEVIKQLSNGKY